jgi:hypothetical protein
LLGGDGFGTQHASLGGMGFGTQHASLGGDLMLPLVIL